MLKRIGVVLGSAVAFVGLMAGVSSAAVDSGTSTAVTGGFTDLKTFMVVTIGTLFIGLAVALIALVRAKGWLKKATGV